MHRAGFLVKLEPAMQSCGSWWQLIGVKTAIGKTNKRKRSTLGPKVCAEIR